MRRFLLLVVLAGAAGWVSICHYHQPNPLHQQLEQLTAVLTAENDFASRNTNNALKTIEEEAAKNRNQPADMALLHRAEALQARAKQLVAALRTAGDQLRHATSNKAAQPLRRLGASIGAALRPGAPPQHALAQRLTAYADTLQLLGLLDEQATPLLAPALPQNAPVAEALADLARLESEILAQQTYALQHISTRVGARRWLTQPLAIATATSTAVAPGGTYRAQLGLIGYYSTNQLKMQMACNGRPVPLTPAGTGLVRFRAPTRPGPAAWTGTIRVSANGRDSTFSVTVPYRVVAR